MITGMQRRVVLDFNLSRTINAGQTQIQEDRNLPLLLRHGHRLERIGCKGIMIVIGFLTSTDVSVAPTNYR